LQEFLQKNTYKINLKFKSLNLRKEEMRMFKMLNKFNYGVLALLGLLPTFFAPLEISAAPEINDKKLQFKNMLDQTTHTFAIDTKDCHKKHAELSFGINALLFNLNNNTISGTIRARVFSPDGKDTVLGKIPFGPLSGSTSIPIIFPPKFVKDSESHGQYTTVIDIHCDNAQNNPFSVNLIGEVLVLNLKRETSTSVNFFDIDFVSTAPNFQLTVPYYFHRFHR